jgi:hypothetical protein
MKKKVFRYVSSLFKFDDQFWKTFLIDLSFFLLATMLIFIAMGYYNYQFNILLQGQSIEQFQQTVTSQDPEVLMNVLPAMVDVLTKIIVSMVMIFLVIFVYFSLSRYLVWSTLLKEKFQWKKFPKWMLLVLALIIPTIAYGFIFIISYILLSGPVYWVLGGFENYLVQSFLLIYDALLKYFLILGLFVFSFFTYYSFQKTRKIWSSFGKAFEMFKNKKIIPVLVSAIVIMIILTMLKLLLDLISSSVYYDYLITTLISTFYFAWLRYTIYKKVIEK